MNQKAAVKGLTLKIANSAASQAPIKMVAMAESKRLYAGAAASADKFFSAEIEDIKIARLEAGQPLIGLIRRSEQEWNSTEKMV